MSLNFTSSETMDRFTNGHKTSFQGKDLTSALEEHLDKARASLNLNRKSRAKEEVERSSLVKGGLRARIEAAQRTVLDDELKRKAIEALKKEQTDAVVVALKKELGAKITQELKDELLPEVVRDMKAELKPSVEKVLKDELMPGVMETLKAELRPQVVDAIRAEVRDDVIDALKEEMRDEVAEQLSQSLSAEIEKELKFELHDEVVAMLKKDLRSEVEGELAVTHEMPSDEHGRQDSMSPKRKRSAELEEQDDEPKPKRARELKSEDRVLPQEQAAPNIFTVHNDPECPQELEREEQQERASVHGTGNDYSSEGSDGEASDAEDHAPTESMDDGEGSENSMCSNDDAEGPADYYQEDWEDGEVQTEYHGNGEPEYEEGEDYEYEDEDEEEDCGEMYRLVAQGNMPVGGWEEEPVGLSAPMTRHGSGQSAQNAIVLDDDN